MLLPEKQIVLERADKLTGAGLCRRELCEPTQNVRTYSLWGVIANCLTQEVIETVSFNVARVTEKVMSSLDNEKLQKGSEGIGYLSGEISKMGLSFIKNVAVNADRFLPIKGIIQLMRYCVESEAESFIQDTTVAEIIASLPVKNDIAYKIYCNKKIESPNEIENIKYSSKELEEIGFLLYFIVRSRCSYDNIKYKSRLEETLRVMEVQNMISDYEAMYRRGAGDKTRQVAEACAGFQNLKQRKIEIDPLYFAKVTRKMSYYMPADCENARQSLVIASNGINAFVEKDLNEGINIIGDAVALFTDAHRGSEDEIKEECHKHLVQQGVEGNTVSEKIIPAADDIRNYYDDLEEK